MANPTIGFISCPLTGESECEVRRTATGKRKLYYVSAAGMITPNLPAGQAFMKKNTRFIGDNAEPLPPVNEQKPVNEMVKTVNEQKPVKKKSLLTILFSEDE